MKNEELVAFWVSECKGVNFVLKLELASGSSLIGLELFDAEDTQPLSLIDSDDKIFGNGCVDGLCFDFDDVPS